MLIYYYGFLTVVWLLVTTRNFSLVKAVLTNHFQTPNTGIYFGITRTFNQTSTTYRQSLKYFTVFATRELVVVKIFLANIYHFLTQNFNFDQNI